MLHDLGPQYTNGGFPQSCATQNRHHEAARQFGITVLPSEKLVAHEWERHGTCSGMPAIDYFKAADAARNRIAIPSMFEPGAGVANRTAAQISKSFRDANGAITNSSLAVICAGPELAEVRICVSKDFKPIACGSGVRDAFRRREVRIPGVR